MRQYGHRFVHLAKEKLVKQLGFAVTQRRTCLSAPLQKRLRAAIKASMESKKHSFAPSQRSKNARRCTRPSSLKHQCDSE
jgi:hypothetical protein